MKKTFVILVTMIIMGTLLGSCTSPRVAINGDTVKVHYTGTLSDGTEFDTSTDGDPLEFTVGGGQMITGFDNAVRGMKVGETKTVTIPAAEAYGEYNDSLVVTIDRSDLASTRDPVVGDRLQMQTTAGDIVFVKVIAVTDTEITVDANPELAGKDLTFEITLVEIEK